MGLSVVASIVRISKSYYGCFLTNKERKRDILLAGQQRAKLLILALNSWNKYFPHVKISLL